MLTDAINLIFDTISGSFSCHYSGQKINYVLPPLFTKWNYTCILCNTNHWINRSRCSQSSTYFCNFWDFPPRL